MSINMFKVASFIAKEMLAELIVKLPFLQTGNSTYEQDFNNSIYAKGDTIQYRRANRRRGGEGATVVTKGVEERTETLTIEIQRNDALEMTSKQQSLFASGRKGEELFYKNYVQPSVLNVVTEVNKYTAKKAAEDLCYWYGSPSTPINSPGILMGLNAFMEDLSMPIFDENPYLITTTQDAVALRNSMLNLFIPNTNERIISKYFQNEVINFQFDKSPLIHRHISGLGAGMTLTIGANVLDGASSITLTGATPSTTGVIKKGDAIQIGTVGVGPYIVAPTSFKVLPTLVQVVAQADADSDISGNVIVQIKDAIIYLTGTSNNANVSSPILSGEAVVVLASHNVNMALTKSCLTYAAPKMVKLDVPTCVFAKDTKYGTGIEVRVAYFADGINDINIMRLDVLFGARFNLEFGVKLLS